MTASTSVDVPTVSLAKSDTFVSLAKKEVPMIPVTTSAVSLEKAPVVNTAKRGRPFGSKNGVSVGGSPARKASASITLASSSVEFLSNGVFLTLETSEGRTIKVRIANTTDITALSANLAKAEKLLTLF